MLNEREPKMRICMLVPTPFPANQGTPGSIREMAEAVVERGHEVHIVTYHLGQDIPVKGPQIHRIPTLLKESAIFVGPTARRPLYDLQMVFKTLEVIRRHPPDLLHAHGYEAALIAWLCRLATGLPILYSGHNTMSDELPSFRFFRPQWLARALARCLDAVVPRLVNRCLPHSTNMQTFFHGMGLSAHTEPVVPFGIDLDGTAPNGQDSNGSAIRQEYGLGDGPVVLYAGLLDRFQRLDLLLEAMREVSWCEPAVKLLVVVTITNAEHLADLRRRAQDMGIADRVVLTRPQTLEGVRRLLPVCDVAVVPRPQVPGFPIKLINYMAAAKPCVLFASSGDRLTHGENAVLAAPDTGAALGAAILEALRDDELRRRIAHNGNRFVRENHDRRLVAQQVCAACISTLEAAGRPAVLAQRPRVSPSLARGLNRKVPPAVTEVSPLPNRNQPCNVFS